MCEFVYVYMNTCCACIPIVCDNVCISFVIFQIKNAKPKVDNGPPLLRADIYMNEGKCYKDAGRIHEVERKNMELMKKINLIYRTQVKTEKLRLTNKFI